MAEGAPRIRPGSRGEIGLVNHLIAQVVGAASGGGPPNVMTTIARHRGLFRRWLAFAGALMPGGRLPRADTELLILRVAHNANCEYEWHHHEQIAQLAGLGADDVARVREGDGAEGWSDRQAVLLRAADELYADRLISDETWAELRPLLSDAELIEVCMLVGHYGMLAGTLNSLEVPLDEVPLGRPTRVMRLVQSVVNRRQGSNA
jgi:alkylhydroperoxidase family enzyme